VALLISDNGFDNFSAKKIFKLKNFGQIFDLLCLVFILRKFAPDVVLCHSNRLMKWSRFLRFVSSAKFVAINHGITFKHSLNCDFAISINQEIADKVTASGLAKARSFVLPNVVKVDQDYFEKKLQNPPTLGIYGRLEPRKGFDILIKAAEILVKKGIDFRLKIGGFEVPGCYGWQTIKDLIAASKINEKCYFVGTVFDKKRFFADVDIFCVPSREEPFGLVILEGFLFSTLVISSNSDGGKFLIKNNQSGLLFENENAEDLAAKISEILLDQKRYNQLTDSAYKRLEKEFSFNFLAVEFEKILQKISSQNA
jgi:glycosyltransferase involved in cell wall biosynthesis